MKKTLLALACAFALSAYATQPGNNGEGQGGCGVGQQTNGCGTPPPPPILIPGPPGPKGDKGDRGEPGRDGTNGTNGTNGVDGKDGKSIAGLDGRDGKDGARGEKGDSANEFATVMQLNSLREEARAIGRNAYAGTAGAIAIGSIPQAPEPGTKIIGAGAGYFRNEGALAVGMSWRSESGKWITKASASVDTRGAFGVGVGAAYVWR